MIFASIRYNLANLLRFSGRESRALFWPYAIAIFLLGIVAAILLFVPIMIDMMTRMMDYAQTHPGGLPRSAPGQPPVLPPELMPDMSRMFAPMLVVNLVSILLLAAAVVRRLHDRDKSGWWAALPLPFQVVAAAVGPAVMREMTKGMTSYPPHQSSFIQLSSLNSAFWWLAFIALVILLVGEGTSGPNRFGDPVQAG